MSAQLKFLLIILGITAVFYLFDFFKRRKITSLMFTVFITGGILFQVFNVTFGEGLFENIVVIIWLLFGLYIILRLFKERRNIKSNLEDKVQKENNNLGNHKNKGKRK